MEVPGVVRGKKEVGAFVGNVRDSGVSVSRRGGFCQGFVGEGGSSTAGQYHSTDFPWESRVAEGEAAVARQLRELAQWKEQQEPGQQGPAAGQPAQGLQKVDASLAAEQQTPQQQQQQPWSALTQPRLHTCSADSVIQGAGTLADEPAAPLPISGDGTLAMAKGSPSVTSYDRSSWENFHSQHSRARFFKERRYLLLEFPQLGVTDPPQHFVEVGCGCGSSLLPVLRSNHTCRVTGCDISPTAVHLFLEAAKQYDIQPERVNAFAFDAASSGTGEPPSSPSRTTGVSESCSPLAGLGADVALLIFTLSALPPNEMLAMLQHAWAALRPGGYLLFRDYGLYDMAQLRFPGSQMLGPNLYVRGDGTLAYFFDLETMSQLAVTSGYEVVECQYACTTLRNRKKEGRDMKRVFVHGVFRKIRQ